LVTSTGLSFLLSFLHSFFQEALLIKDAAAAEAAASHADQLEAWKAEANEVT
jgi:hypothetical protein